jgi:hypothetical protein
MNIFELWNESSEFPLFLVGKFALIQELFGLGARFRKELCSQAKVPLHLLNLGVCYRSDGRFWPVKLCCAVFRRKSASLRLVSMRSDTVLPQ